MKYAPSYHRERHTGFFAQEIYSIKSPPHPDIVEEIKRMPKAAELYGPFEYSDAFIKDYVARWKEIEKKYRPDFMWIDDVPIFYKVKPHSQTKKFKNAFMYMIADYFNAAEQWGKEVYLNNKGKNLNWPEGPGCLEKDNLKLETIGPKWENPATLGTSYGYMKAEELRDAYKNPTELIHLLCDIVSKNGNLLLNIGPRADGTIPDGMKQRLLAIGKWLDVNGEAIYGTRPWITFKQDTPDIRFTITGNVLYAIALEKPKRPFVIQSTKDCRIDAVTTVKLLDSDIPIKWKDTDEGIRITPPQTWPGKHAWVFKIKKKPERKRSSKIPDNLSTAALQTHIRYMKDIKTSEYERSKEIPRKYWVDEIKKLNPIKIYLHGTNIVVVQNETANKQEGLYIVLMISSYAPRSGDDGFIFTDIGNSVYKFERIIEN
jgi:alpha-L-fucosidase